ncbi:MAG: hypothetical protein J7K40_05410, partial [candidate division Zixibacteria bacterium]|nr:hypothetical protein [candidate division Zixibacteria bacterium]
MKRLNLFLTLVFSLSLFVGLIYADENQWSSNGPYAARVMTIAIHPFDNNTIYIGTIENGIYKTIDGGADWIWLETGALEPNMRVLRIHPLAPDTIYAATNKGIYKSTDAGVSWTQMRPPYSINNEYRTLEIHPENPNIIFAGTLGALFKSEDGGQYWRALDLPMAALRPVRIDPVNTNIMYVGTGTAENSKSVYKSEDMGETWHCIHNDLDTTSMVEDMAIDPVNTQIIYLARWDFFEATGECVTKSIDGGNHWFDITPDNLIDPLVWVVTISPIQNNTVFIGTRTNGVLRSTDGGDTWQEINEGLNSRTIHSIEIDPETGIIYIGAFFDGIYRSLDNGDSWEKISNHILQATTTDLAVNWRNSDSVYAATKCGFYKSADGGLSWDLQELCSPIYDIGTYSLEVDPHDPNFIYVGYYPNYDINNVYRGGIYRSSDGGSTWQSYNNGLPLNSPFYGMAIADYQNGSRRIYLSSRKGAYYSDDLAQTWTACGGGIPSNHAFYSLDVSPVNPDIVFLGEWGINNMNIFKTVDGGTNWEITDNFPHGLLLNQIVCDPVNQDIVYVGTGGIDQAGIFKSMDGGNTWLDINNNLPYDENFISVTGIAINPLNPNNLFTNSQFRGIYISNNGGQSWEDFNQGLRTHYGNCLTVIDPSDTSKIFLANFNSVW